MRVIRSFLVLAFVAIAFAALPAFAIRDENPCKRCYSNQDNGVSSTYCASPADGTGSDECTVTCFGWYGVNGNVQCFCMDKGYWCMTITVIQ